MEFSDQASLESWHASQIEEDEPPFDLPSNPLDPETATALILLLCTPSNTGGIYWQSALRRLAVIASIINPEIGNQSFESIAQQLTKAGVPTCRATLSAINVKLSDATGFNRSCKTESARAAYRKRAFEVWGREGTRKKKTAKHTPP